MISEPERTDGLGRVVIRRDASDDIKMRDLFVKVADREEFRLDYGESRDLFLPTGHHTIRATNRAFSKELEFDLAPAESVAFQVVNVATKGVLSTLLMLTGTVLYKVRLTRVTDSSRP